MTAPTAHPASPARPAERLAGGCADSGGVWISWRAHGPETGSPPLLMIMGLAVSSRGWWRLLPHVSAGRTCITFDNRGTGDSDRPRGPYAMADLVGDTVAVMDAAGVDRAHVLGASMGGMVAQQLALAHPDRVASLVLACTTPTSGGRIDPRFAATTLMRPVLRPERAFLLAAPILYAPRTLERRRGRVEEDLRVRLEHPAPALTVFSQLAAVRGHDLRPRLGEISAPTLVVHGEQDRLVSPSLGRELAERIPGARLVLVPHAGHILTTDAEEETAEAVNRFLEEIDG